MAKKFINNVLKFIGSDKNHSVVLKSFLIKNKVIRASSFREWKEAYGYHLLDIKNLFEKHHLKVSLQSISNWVNGSSPDYRKLSMLSKITGIKEKNF